jgi:hypothetical protein
MDPTAPLLEFATWKAGQADAVQVAAVKVPVVQLEVPLTVYPGLQVGAQVLPLARLLVQSPAVPLPGALDASQGFAAQVAAVKVPEVQLEVPLTV